MSLTPWKLPHLATFTREPIADFLEPVLAKIPSKNNHARAIEVLEWAERTYP
ncbi:hypothetical protein V3M69_03375 [Trueperella pyogenes]|uniref:hypothetical protein n=1 Tax=Trueperella pyogenes TaxID=1661 RepID=UPI0013E0DBF0|nr:hypothetical protein [Trueperella pyogenes]MCI7688841.1 hypothetical protein [Trueperella pyogenes]QIU86658.1 hypothetical protein HEP79_05060 [Trueperella pyogenes]WHU56360.1 hypothetical protein QEV10_06255 [Trueperella pyogenes]WHU61791.1 hypothetical protein QEV13_03935 [Trueperella pyogenes]